VKNNEKTDYTKTILVNHLTGKHWNWIKLTLANPKYNISFAYNPLCSMAFPPEI
jgi:hypothetical protein